MLPKKSEAVCVTIRLESKDAPSLAAALVSEEFSFSNDDFSLEVTVHGDDLTEVRAKANTALRSLQAASESLIEVSQPQRYGE